MTTTGQEPPGCVAIPVLIVVVPLRLLWEVLRAAARLIGIALHFLLVRALAWLFGVVLWPPLRWFVLEILVPVAGFLWRYVLRPLGLALGWTLWALARPFVWLGRGLAALWTLILPALRAIGRALAYCARLAGIALYYVFVVPVAWVWRSLVMPVLRATWRVFAYCWRLAGIVLFNLLVRPVVWVWRTLVMPVLRAVAAAWRATVVPAARWLGSNVWEPARAAARSVSRALGLDTRPR